MDPTTDSSNCDGCGKVCPNGQTCQDSACRPAADGCAGCVLPNATTQCVHRVCNIVTCATGYADCNQGNMDGCEVALTTDRDNCGGCGKACAISEQCAAGACH